jgi:hypothetical protein
MKAVWSSTGLSKLRILPNRTATDLHAHCSVAEDFWAKKWIVFTAKITVFWNVMLCKLVAAYGHLKKSASLLAYFYYEE